VELPPSAAVVLRDRTNSDPQQVLVTAIDDLVAAGVWGVTRRRRGLRRRRSDVLEPLVAGSPVLVEPLAYADGVLRRIAAEQDGRPLDVQEVARRLAVKGRHAPGEAVRRTIADLLARGLLDRTGGLGPSPAGAALLAQRPAPPALRPTARDPRARRDAIRALSPLGAAFVTAWAATPTGRGGFAFGTVGSGYDAGGHAVSGGWITGGGGAGGGGDCGGGGHGGGGGDSGC
jgi:uncharacterized membrane protein YgcG